MPDTDKDILEYVGAAKDSSDRGRLVLIVIITVSVLTFAAFWNSRQEGWLSDRLHMARLAAEGCRSGWNKNTENNLPIEDKGELFARSKRFYDLRHFHSCNDVLKLAENLEMIQTEQVNSIKVPFFGFQFDINDLGVLGGFAFVVVLLWFRFSLSRELSNVSLAFHVAKEKGVLQACYDLLAMRQVFTLPPARVGTPQFEQNRFWKWVSSLADRLHLRHVRFWGKLPFALYFLPLGVHFSVVANDFRTWRYGWSVSPGNTIGLFCTNVVFLVAIFVLTFLCLLLSSEIDGVWEHFGKELVVQAKQNA